MQKLILCCLILFSGFGITTAQSLDFFIIGHPIQGDQTTSDDITLKVDDATLGGFGSGISFGKFNLNIDLLFGSTTVKSPENTLDTKLSTFDLNLDYRFFKFPLSPVVSVGFGSMTFSDSFSKIENFNETDVSLNYGAGLQANIGSKIMLKALYRTTSTKLKDTDSALNFRGICVTLGYRLRVR